MQPAAAYPDQRITYRYLLCSRYGQIKKKGNKKSWDAVKTAPQANGVENGKISCWR